jgi:hypothetical protein
MKAIPVLLALALALPAPAFAAAYVDEAQCFGGAVPTLPGPVAASVIVNATRGTYLVTAWRQECQSTPGAFALVLKFQASTGTPSIAPSEILVEQAGNRYRPSLLVRDPRAATQGAYMQMGTFTLITTIVEQAGARFDVNGALRIEFFDAVLGAKALTLPAGPTALPSANIATAFGNYGDMWWDPAENGTGMSIIHHGSNQLFAVWYTYTEAGEPLWLVIPGGTWESNRLFAGQVYKARGTSYTRPWNPANFQIGTPIGTARFNFSEADELAFSYTINGTAGARTFTRQLF